MSAISKPTLAVFASDAGPGDPERASLMSQAATLLARRGYRIVCLADEGLHMVPLVTGARAAGGEVLIIADSESEAPAALAEVPLERIADDEARLERVSKLADAFVGLPGSLRSAAALYRCWQRAGAGGSGKPVILLNRHRAYEAMRGFSADIISHSVRRADRIAVYTDNVEDLPNKVAWALSTTG